MLTSSPLLSPLLFSFPNTKFPPSHSAHNNHNHNNQLPTFNCNSLCFPFTPSLPPYHFLFLSSSLAACISTICPSCLLSPFFFIFFFFFPAPKCCSTTHSQTLTFNLNWVFSNSSHSSRQAKVLIFLLPPLHSQLSASSRRRRNRGSSVHQFDSDE